MESRWQNVCKPAGAREGVSGKPAGDGDRTRSPSTGLLASPLPGPTWKLLEA